MKYLIFRDGVSQGSYDGDVSDEEIARQAVQGLTYLTVSDEEFAQALGTHLLAEDGTMNPDVAKRAEITKRQDDRSKARGDIFDLDLSKPLGNPEELIKAIITHLRGF